MPIDEDLRRECASQARKLEEGLVAIEQEVDGERVADLFRIAHSLKGNCGMAGLDGAQRLAHAVEDLLSDVRADRVEPEGGVVDVALAAVDDIAAMLDGAEPPVSPADRADRLRSALQEARERSTADGSDRVDLSSLTLPPADPDEDVSVEEALRRASTFDDLDSLAEAIDDATEFADLEGGGSFADLGLDQDDVSADAEARTGGTQSDMFDRIKAEVEQEDTDSLQRALEDVRFGEFDDEDDVTIQELIDLDPTDDADEREERAASPDADASDTADEPAFAGSNGDDVFADMPGANGPEDARAETDPDAPADPVAESGDDPVTSAAGSGEPDTAPEHPGDDPPAFDSPSSAFEAMKSEVETGDVEGLESDLETVRFGEFDEEDDVSIQDLIDGTAAVDEPPGEPASSAGASPTVETDAMADADAESTEADAIESFPDLDAEPASTVETDATADADAESTEARTGPEPATGGEDTAEAESVADAETPATESADTDDGVDDGAAAMEWSSPEEPPDADEPLSGTGDIRSRELPDAFAPADEDAADVDAPAGTDEGETATTVDAGSIEPAPERPDAPAAGAAESAATDEATATTDEATATTDEATATTDEATATTDEATDIDVPDLELPDLDVVTPPSLDATEPDASAVESDPGFERDASTVEFESRFADLVGGDPTVVDGEEEFPRTALTIADSTLDAAQFQAPADVATSARRTAGTDDFQSITVDVETADSLLNLVEELSMLRLDMEDAVGRNPDPAVEESLTDLQGFLARFRRTVMDVRLMPLRSAVEGLPRVVRDVSQETDVEVTLETTGTDVKLDRSIIDRLRDPLVHLVRNAVDHGIEPPDVREAAGKPREGRVTVEAERVRDRVEIVVSDDGRGIDPGEVREAAIDQGVLSPEAAHDMDRQGLFDLLFRAGFTTTTEVTSVSGRGVGMDVVHRVVSDLDGDVSVESAPGEGTTVILSLPVTVAVTEVLFVESGTEQYGIPVSTVEQVSDPGPVVTEDGTELIERDPFVSPAAAAHDDERAADAAPGDGDGEDDAVERYPLVRLASAFDVPGEIRDGGKVVWVRPGEDRLAIHCDRVREAREVVVKPYEEFLAHVPGISGATMLGNGSVVNIIDVQSI